MGANESGEPRWHICAGDTHARGTIYAREFTNTHTLKHEEPLFRDPASRGPTLGPRNVAVIIEPLRTEGDLLI